ncbi:hypothetical protein Tco_1204054 [Tanacetum coccineum]
MNFVGMFSENPHDNFHSPLGATEWFKKAYAYANATVISTKLIRKALDEVQDTIKLMRSNIKRSYRMIYRMKKSRVMVDVARGNRLGAWLRACCLFILPSKSRTLGHESGVRRAGAAAGVYVVARQR